MCSLQNFKWKIHSNLLSGLNLVFRRIGSKNLLGNCPDKMQEIPFILLNPVEIRPFKSPLV